LVSTDPRRRYGAEELELAKEIAGRAALHIDNTRLYAAQAKAAAQAARLQGLVDATFSASNLDDMLDELLRRVTEELGTQFAVFLLMDESGSALSVRGSRGLEEEATAGVRVPVGHGFAGRVASTRKPLIVEDVRSIVVVSPYLGERARSIVGVPLVLENEVIGVLHTGSLNPRTFSSEDVTLLQLAADRAAVAIRRAELYEREHQIASLLQQSLRPEALPSIPGLELSALFHAAGRGVEVGGDFYDVFRIEDSTWGLVVGDVCGRGPEAAAVTGLAKNAIRALALRQPDPGSVLEALNDTMIRSEADRFCTATYARVRLSPGTAKVSVARAGMPPLMVRRAGGSVEEVNPAGPLLGVFQRAEFAVDSFILRPHDGFLIFTDGLVEGDTPFSSEKDVARLLESSAGHGAHEIIESLESAFGRLGRQSMDDVVALAAMLRP